VLLVHGFASSFVRNWRQPGWVDLLEEEGRHVIGVDLLGHGTAEKPHDPDAYAALGREVAAALPASGLVDAIGFSLGARLLLDVVIEAPDRFRRVVVAGVGENLFRDVDHEPSARAMEAGVAQEGDPVTAQAFARFGRAPGNDPAALAACLRRRIRPLDPRTLSAVVCPVLVVLGDRDYAAPADRLLDALPDAKLLTLRGTDHFGTPRDFRFLEAALEFLRN
jgi:pimeloyl-ACP methyl ester carboxylesterase